MEWTDARGRIHTGAGAGGAQIPHHATDTTGGAFPRGSVRWKNLGHDQNGIPFDLLVTVNHGPPSADLHLDILDLEYWNPQAQSQAMYTDAGFACLGLGLRPSYCQSGAPLNASTGWCLDGTFPIVRAAEFVFSFVESGTTTLLPPLKRTQMSIFDIDGDNFDGGSILEFVGVMSASTRTIHPSSTVFNPDVPSSQLYAMASENINILTDFDANPYTPTEVSLPGVASFDVVGSSSFKVLLGGASTFEWQSDRAPKSHAPEPAHSAHSVRLRCA